MKIIVQKFGGTSVADASRRAQVVEHIKKAVDNGFTPVVVVSAMGRAGDPYATDTLINLAKSIEPEINLRELDLLMSCGEIISCVVMAATLKNKGFDTIVLTGAMAGIITDNNFSNARILRVQPDYLLDCLEKGMIPVVAGFQGVTETGHITTLGRGGSDTTASALGVALNAQMIEIYTDVDGVKTADPRIVEDAKTIDVITYQDLCQLAHEGAKVIHPRAVEIAMQKNIPLVVKSTFSDSPGTLITHTHRATRAGIEITGDKLVTAVTHIPAITQITVFTENFTGKPEVDLRIFKSLANEHISVDLINVYPEKVVFTVKDEEAEKAAKILTDGNFKVNVLRNCAKVSIVGAGMRGIPGVMANMVEALAKENIVILQTADSHNTISCLVKQDDMIKAVQALHNKFQLSA